MTPLIQAPSVIPQLILSLCTISIATFNKLFEIMMPFNGDKIRPRLALTFDLAFGPYKPKQISKPQSCVPASGDKISSYGVLEVDLFIKGKKIYTPSERDRRIK
jgi:hypothetical protein